MPGDPRRVMKEAPSRAISAAPARAARRRRRRRRAARLRARGAQEPRPRRLRVQRGAAAGEAPAAAAARDRGAPGLGARRRARGWSSAPRSPGPGFVNLWLAGARWHDLLRRGPRARAALRPLEGRRRDRAFRSSSSRPIRPVRSPWVTAARRCSATAIARLLEAARLRGDARVLLQRRRPPDARARRVGARPLPGAARAGGAAAARGLRRTRGGLARRDRRAAGGLPPRRLPGRLHRASSPTQLRREHGDGLVDEPGDGPDIFRRTAEERIFADIRRTLADLGIEFDVYSNEMDLYEEGKIEETLADLRERDLVYDADGAVWLRATELGLDRDRVLVKSTRRADLPAARHRLPPREVPARLRSR